MDKVTPWFQGYELPVHYGEYDVMLLEKLSSSPVQRREMFTVRFNQPGFWRELHLKDAKHRFERLNVLAWRGRFLPERTQIMHPIVSEETQLIIHKRRITLHLS